MDLLWVISSIAWICSVPTLLYRAGHVEKGPQFRWKKRRIAAAFLILLLELKAYFSFQPLDALAVAAALVLQVIEIKNSPFVTSSESLVFWASYLLLKSSRWLFYPSTSGFVNILFGSLIWLLNVQSAPRNPENYEDCSIFGKVNMIFVTKMIKTSMERGLRTSDLAGIPKTLRTTPAYTRLTQILNKTEGKYRVIKSMILASKWKILAMLSLESAADLLTYLSPIFLSKFLKIMHNEIHDIDTNVYGRALFYILGISCTRVITQAILGLKQIVSNQVLLESRASLMQCIYDKALSMDYLASHEYDASKIMNLLNVDTVVVQMAYSRFSVLVNTVLNFTLCLTQLHLFLGSTIWVASPLYIAYIAFSSWATKRKMRRFPEIMQAKDKRAKSTITVIRNIKSLKLYAWEPAFEEEVKLDRKEELGVRRKYLKIDVLFESVTSQLDSFGVAIVFVAFLMFTNKPLTPEIVFPVLSLMSLVSYPLFAFPRAITALARAFTSQNRINEFLSQPNAKFENYTRIIDCLNKDRGTIDVVDATISWGPDNKTAIANLSLFLKPGNLCCVVGPVGSGKSALLKSLCSQLTVISGSMTLYGRMAYCSQTPWLQFKTVKQNILFGLELDDEFYKTVVHACDLEPDFLLFPNGDDTEVGEKGINLSGGQKARVALARAVYSRADIVVLDDVLSALDQTVSRHLIKTLFSAEGLLSGTTVIIATNSIELMEKCDHLVELKEGEVVYNGPNPSNEVKRSVNTLQSLSIPVAAEEELKEIKPEAEQDIPILKVFKEYMDIAGKNLAVCALSALVLAVFADSLVNLWLGVWSGKGLVGLEASKFYIYVYLALLLVAGTLFALSYYTNLGSLSLKAGQLLHDNMLHSIVHAPMSYFERTSVGTIMNSFTGDINTIDTTLPTMMYSFVRTLVTLIVNMVISVMGAPFILLVAVPLFFKYVEYRNQFVACSKQLQKLSRSSRAPILGMIEESVHGQTTINVFDKRQSFIEAYIKHSDYWMHTSFLKSAMRRWLNYRISLMSSFLILSSGVSVFLFVEKGWLPISFAGIVVFSMQKIGRWLSYIISSWSDLEVSFVAAERVFDNINLESEGVFERGPEHWLEVGSINFNEFCTQFREDTPEILHDISLDIKPGEKIGVVGRTGAGKSSLALAIFRILKASSGSIQISAHDISELGLKNLRQELSIIPQDVQIFKGTLRRNIDPFSEHSDERVWDVLESCHLSQHFESLEHELREGGENISAGMGQLICLARALLRPSKILVLDEATASVDNHTDELVQNTIRKEFEDRTIITIAHRINTILNSDRVLVLNNGRVAEFDRPETLLEAKGLFYEMLHGK